MSTIRHPKDIVARYEMLSDWDEVLLGDKELFNEMTERYLPMLIKAAAGDIKRERLLGHLKTNALQPEELVAETILHAWAARHERSEHRPLKDWLLTEQKQVLQKIIIKENKFQESTAISLEAPVPSNHNMREDEKQDWEWHHSSVADCWADVIPDGARYSLAGHA